jgi:hypothetical protein
MGRSHFSAATPELAAQLCVPLNDAPCPPFASHGASIRHHTHAVIKGQLHHDTMMVVVVVVVVAIAWLMLPWGRWHAYRWEAHTEGKQQQQQQRRWRRFGGMTACVGVVAASAGAAAATLLLTTRLALPSERSTRWWAWSTTRWSQALRS